MTALSRLVIVRHGETVGNSSVRYYGRTDIALADVGRAQMRAARRAIFAQLGCAPFAQIFASPLSRAQESARIIAGAMAEVITIAEFSEVDFGAFEGLTAEEIAARYPAEYARWNRDRIAATWTFPGGESRAEFTARVARGVDRMMAQRMAGDTLVVAHRGVIRAMTRMLAAAEPIIELGSIQVLRSNGADKWEPELLDFTAHLAARD